MNGQLTTHVLDLSRGIPAAGLSLQLWRLGDGEPELKRQAVTNADGRLDAPLLAGDELEAGCYELLFMAGDYFRGAEAGAGAGSGAGVGVGVGVGASASASASASAGERGAEAVSLFLEHIPIRFNILDPAAHYHVPLLVAPGGYSTYRGS
ncbi:hydroxyisourate hydrolase [Paenibacillus tritici]|uniref:hydroxyisourate hydrolase n=1 Tax=Paenibacillus tritici TaxID=1873425 RepID=UPI001BA6B6E2|nr:hydroxyisourate hydrolase [Paenibacillus tritici]QUL56214.1 hydroxyisourate hydrolase [Paenibacillus tritici]